MSKNKLKTTLETQEINGVTLTVNSNGSISLSGTASAGINVTVGTYTATKTETLIVSGGLSSSVYVMFNSVRSSSDATVSVKKGTSYPYTLWIGQGAVVDDLTVYPMLREDGTDSIWTPYGAETGKVNVARRVDSVEKSQSYNGYAAVRVIAGTDDDNNELVYEAGDTTGRTLEVSNPFGTQEMAENILTLVRGYQYQPLTASGAMLNPAAELGDGISVNNVYSGIFKRSTTFNYLMKADVEAPYESEVDHEYAYETKENREYSRFKASTKTSLKITSEAITALAEKTTEDLTKLSSELSQTAESIKATVTEITDTKLDKTGGDSSFSWELTATGFYLKNGSTEVFKATKDGIEVTGKGTFSGKITATSGYIGNGSSGFTIGNKAIYNGKTSLTDTNTGVYIGTDGIALGNNAFKVTSAGAVTATNLIISGGSINIGNGKFVVDSSGNLTANSGTFLGNVRADRISWGNNTGGYMSGGGISGSSIAPAKMDSDGQYGISGGSYFNKMEIQKHTADWVCANHIICYSGGSISGMHYGSWQDSYGTTKYPYFNYKTLVTGVTASLSTSTYQYYFQTTNGNVAAYAVTGKSVGISKSTTSANFLVG